MNKRSNPVALVLIYALLLIAVLMTLLPLGWIFSTSFKPSTEIFQTPPRWIPQNPTMVNYQQVLFNSTIPRAFLNSLLVGLISALLALLIGGAAGYGFARFRFKGNRTLSMFMLISQMLPLTVLMIPMYYMESNVGLLDTPFGLAVAHLVITLPLVTWMAKGYFLGIPKEIEEAASIDGCSTLQAVTWVVLPLVRPALAATGIYAFISSWNEFTLANVLTQSDNSKTVPIALSQFSTFFKVDWGSTMAAAAIITIPVIVVFMCVQKYFVSGLVNGAVKG